MGRGSEDGWCEEISIGLDQTGKMSWAGSEFLHGMGITVEENESQPKDLVDFLLSPERYGNVFLKKIISLEIRISLVSR